MRPSASDPARDARATVVTVSTTDPRPAAGESPDATTARTRAVVAQLQVALNVLVAGLLALTMARAATDLRGGERVWALTLGVLFAVVYVAGTVWQRHRPYPRWAPAAWLATVTALWALLDVHVTVGAYLAFPLFFLAIAVLGTRRGIVAVAAITALAVTVLGVGRGWTAAGVTGPVVGALVAIGVSVGVRALQSESAARRRVIADLVRTRSELAARQRDVGRESERTRLAGEIHDTVAQGLSSIGMLLYAVERADPEHPAIDRIRLARTTATESLAETRRLIAALRPAALEGTTVPGALRRLAARLEEHNPGLAVDVDTSAMEAGAELPASVATALVRIAQEATANAAGHGAPNRIGLELRRVGPPDAVELVVTDDGAGFEPDAPRASSSFGLEGMARRAIDLGGTVAVDSAPGRGTTVRARLPVTAPPEDTATPPRAVTTATLPATDDPEDRR